MFQTLAYDWLSEYDKITTGKLNTAKLSTMIHMESLQQEMDSVLAHWEEKENSTPDEE